MDFLLLWLFTVVAGYWVFKKLRELQTLPPGPWGLPIVGYLPFIDRHQPHLTLTKLSRQYGPIYGLKMGSIYTVILSDHKLIREAFTKDAFSGRAPLYLTHGIMHGNGIICAEGALWKDQRKLVTSWLKSFGMSKHSLFRGNLQKRISSGIYELMENVDINSGMPIDLVSMLTNSLGNVVNEIIFGFKYPAEDKTWHWFRKIQEEGAHEMGVSGVVNFLPFIRFISPSTQKTIHLLTRGQEQTHKLYASIINRRRNMLKLEVPEGAEYAPHQNIFKDHPQGFIKCVKYSKHSDNTEEHYFDPSILTHTEEDNILDNFLYEQKRRFDEDDCSKIYVKDEQLLYLLADMFGAGLDTTSVTMAWFLLYMAIHQDEQDLVRREILSVYPEDSEVDITKLPYLMAAISETQRIRSIVPVGIPHGCTQNTLLGQYIIPEGAMVMPLQWALHMNPDIWVNPEEFKPSRFIDPNGNLLKPLAFIPFQTGKRMCPGDELSRMLASGLIARLFRSKKVRLASEVPSAEKMAGAVGVTLSPPYVEYYCESI